MNAIQGPHSFAGVVDTVANVDANFVELEKLYTANNGPLPQIHLTDSGTPTLQLTAEQMQASTPAGINAVLSHIDGSFHFEGVAPNITTITGSNGDDLINVIGTGQESINSLAGDDDINYTTNTHAALTGTDTITTGNGQNYVELLGDTNPSGPILESLVVNFGNGHNYLYGKDANINSVIPHLNSLTVTMGSGDNHIILSNIDVNSVSVSGGSGNNVIYAAYQSANSTSYPHEVINAGSGNDTIVGSLHGDQQFIAGNGNDSISLKSIGIVNTSTDTVSLGNGNDVVKIIGNIYGANNLVVSMGDGKDVFGSDTPLTPGIPSYLFNSLTVSVGIGDDIIDLRNMYTESGTVHVGAGHDTVYAGYGNETVFGGNGGDSIVGGGPLGGIGSTNFDLIGGTGNDTLTAISALTNNSQADVITDFTHGLDHINILG